MSPAVAGAALTLALHHHPVLARGDVEELVLGDAHVRVHRHHGWRPLVHHVLGVVPVWGAERGVSRAARGARRYVWGKEKEEGSGEGRRKEEVSKGRKRREKCGKKERGIGRGQGGSRVRRKEEGHQRAEEDDIKIRRQKRGGYFRMEEQEVRAIRNCQREGKDVKTRGGEVKRKLYKRKQRREKRGEKGMRKKGMRKRRKRKEGLVNEKEEEKIEKEQKNTESEKKKGRKRSGR